jgi:hypothetical protein
MDSTLCRQSTGGFAGVTPEDSFFSSGSNFNAAEIPFGFPIA